jgi:hypothetical protein
LGRLGSSGILSWGGGAREERKKEGYVFEFKKI